MRFAFPEDDSGVGAHHVGAIARVQVNRRTEGFAPFDHRRIEMWVRNPNSGDTTEHLYRLYCRVVNIADTVPQYIADGRLYQQRTLGNSEPRLGFDTCKSRLFSL